MKQADKSYIEREILIETAGDVSKCVLFEFFLFDLYSFLLGFSEDEPSSAYDEPSMLRSALRAAGRSGFKETNGEANERTRKRTAETIKISETATKKGQMNLAIVMARN